MHHKLAPLMAGALATALAACASTPVAARSTTVARAGGCGATRLDTLEVAEGVKRLATSMAPGTVKMRADVGITAPAMAPTDSVRFSGDPEVCGKAAAMYARVFGPAPAARGVLVTRFGPYWLIARPDGRPRPLAILATEAFEQRMMWGL
jgi:hypothetical protein